MKKSKIKKIVLIQNKIFLYIIHDDIYIKINSLEKRKKIKFYKIKKIHIVEYIIRFIKKFKKSINNILKVIYKNRNL